MKDYRSRILVVDEESDISLLFDQYFKDKIAFNKLSFDYVKSGEEALDRLANDKEINLILILSDINMPGISGLNLLKKIKQTYPKLKVFMLTEYGDVNSTQLAWEYGADELINKPIDFNCLMNLISNLEKIGYDND